MLSIASTLSCRSLQSVFDSCQCVVERFIGFAQRSLSIYFLFLTGDRRGSFGELLFEQSLQLVATGVDVEDFAVFADEDHRRNTEHTVLGRGRMLTIVL